MIRRVFLLGNRKCLFGEECLVSKDSRDQQLEGEAKKLLWFDYNQFNNEAACSSSSCDIWSCPVSSNLVL